MHDSTTYTKEYYPTSVKDDLTIITVDHKKMYLKLFNL